MARRIKEDPIVHQNRIASQAMLLFARKGIDNTKMDEIATQAGYSKATLYVYFKNKKDIVSFLSLQSMEKLKKSLEEALSVRDDLEGKFMRICQSLVIFQKEYPDFFAMSLKYIGFDSPEDGAYDAKTYELGEEINQLIYAYLKEGIKQGEFREFDNFFATEFQIWGMISGIITLASEKEKYIIKAGKMTKEEFLQDGFSKIYQMLRANK